VKQKSVFGHFSQVGMDNPGVQETDLRNNLTENFGKTKIFERTMSEHIFLTIFLENKVGE
jgi:hypothetical protein